MDQDFFRDLLSTSSGSSGASTSRGSLLSKTGWPKSQQKPAVVGSSEAAFKPRKVNKAEKYRDRASERRLGEGNDYAQVEAVLEDFEKSTADQDRKTVEGKRHLLGGDGEHSVLVKGLDVALLERNKAKEAMGQAAEEDDELEKALLHKEDSTPAHNTTVATTSGKKRTREDLIRELKNKRAGGEGAATPSDGTVIDKGKFKPIGFKPIGAPTEEKAKKRKVKGDGEKKKKKRKVQDGEAGQSKPPVPPREDSTTVKADLEQTAASPPKPTASQPEPDIPDDFDIFADAGEYEGVDLGEDDDDNEDSAAPPAKPPKQHDDQPLTNHNLRPGRWFDDDPEEKSRKSEPMPEIVAPSTSNSAGPHTSKYPEEGQLDEMEEEEEPTRLIPLSSSTLPSIKDILAMDEQAEKAEKRKKRKEKQKNKEGGGSELTAEARANRDYQRLKSFQEKRGDK